MYNQLLNLYNKHSTERLKFDPPPPKRDVYDYYLLGK